MTIDVSELYTNKVEPNRTEMQVGYTVKIC